LVYNEAFKCKEKIVHNNSLVKCETALLLLLLLLLLSLLCYFVIFVWYLMIITIITTHNCDFDINIYRVFWYKHIQGVSGGIVNILGGGSMDYSE
jgi:hypothetical protein